MLAPRIPKESAQRTELNVRNTGLWARQEAHCVSCWWCLPRLLAGASVLGMAALDLGSSHFWTVSLPDGRVCIPLLSKGDLHLLSVTTARCSTSYCWCPTQELLSYNLCFCAKTRLKVSISWNHTLVHLPPAFPFLRSCFSQTFAGSSETSVR